MNQVLHLNICQSFYMWVLLVYNIFPHSCLGYMLDHYKLEKKKPQHRSMAALKIGLKIGEIGGV